MPFLALWINSDAPKLTSPNQVNWRPWSPKDKRVGITPLGSASSDKNIRRDASNPAIYLTASSLMALHIGRQLVGKARNVHSDA